MDQHKLGMKVEQEHSDTIKAIIADAKAGTLKPVNHYIGLFADDHIDEIKDYYTRLIAMEDEAKKAAHAKHEKKESKKTEADEDDERVEKAFKSWRPTAEKSESTELPCPVGQSKGEPYYPQVDLEKEGDCPHKVGDSHELAFKAHVHSISKTDKGHRITYKLKEVKE